MRSSKNSITKAIGASKEDGEKRPHAHHGAALALGAPRFGRWRFAIYGHHAGLHDRSDSPAGGLEVDGFRAHECEAALTGREEWSGEPWPLARLGPDHSACVAGGNRIRPQLAERDAKMRAVEFYARMLFSALVDADRLDTEEANPRRQARRRMSSSAKAGASGHECLAANGAVATAGTLDAAESLRQTPDAAMLERSCQGAVERTASDAVLDVRAEVLAACKEKAAGERGVFTLAVPTGGGKTLASVAFALPPHRAPQQEAWRKTTRAGLRRIIVVIPYLNIIQQTSRELRMVFGDLVWVKKALDPLTGKKVKHPVKDEEGAWLESSAPDHKPLVLEHHSQASDPEIKGPDKSKADKDADGYDQGTPAAPARRRELGCADRRHDQR
ncbi:MAG: hypothetical protein V9H26_03365 [Verrucomicrobiota bacterium]